MYRDVWINHHKAVCSIEFYGSSGSHISGLTGFRTGDLIITDDLIYSIIGAKQAAIRFYAEDGLTIVAERKMNYRELLEIIPQKNDFENLGFVAIPADFPEFKNTGSLELSRSRNSSLGLEAVSMAFQTEYRNISIKSALVSSYYRSERGLTYLQYDGTVKPGSSGGPLIDVQSAQVIGIITNKEMKIVKNYHKLMEIIRNNLSLLKEEEGKWQINDIDPIQVLIASQNQIRHVAREFIKNSTVRIGFALEVGHLVELLESAIEYDFDINLKG